MANLNKFIPVIEFHPGETLSEKLKEMGMSTSEFARQTAIPVEMIQSVINGYASITTEMAAKFEEVTLIPAHFWLNMQQGFDQYTAGLRSFSYPTPSRSYISTHA